ncbi:peptidase M16 [Brumimicrobium salinarum]|uniref:Peptidase M16 n=1 Tax=Brumimicrobium salinarum TaxID=2058658 RepID=A0A2I0R1X3_9FLAO|nr:pitrilysin family protein [Brumimicrobium salinarum]PKR80400.1 peptidase M16 [Brumimicrobium salinarum]
MKKIITSLLVSSLLFNLSAQETSIDFVEFDLDNGMHVILHEDNSTPIVAVSVMYHVGSKNENPNRTGFAHFFEHLMFEGSENIERGEFDKYIERNGGTLNAYTSQDKTYYYEIFSSNNLELGLWLESERLLHAKVDNKGIETQREVVKEEKRQRVDNQPYGSFMAEAFDRLFQKHPYKWTPIGYMEHLDAAQEEDYVNFYKTFYVPANATLSIAGDINVEEAKVLIEKYFGSIPKGQAINLYRDYLNMNNETFKSTYGEDKSIFNKDNFFATTSKDGKALINKYKEIETVIPRPEIVEPPLEKEIVDTVYDNIQLPAVFIGYHSPAQNTKDAYALEMLNSIISGGTSARMNKNIVEEKELAVSAFSFAFPLEDPGMALFAGIASKDTDIEDLKKALDAEISTAKNELVTEKEFQKVKNQFENDFYSSNSSVAGKAEALANYHVYFNNTNLINEQLKVYEDITREDLKEVAQKYFKDNARLILYYLPK